MTAVDATKKISPLDKIPLKWVGMGNLKLPLKMIFEAKKANLRKEFLLTAKINAFVDLVKPSRGIHMSRIYSTLQEFSETSIVNLKQFKDLALRILATHTDLSRAVRLEIELEVPFFKKSLKSELAYQQVYPLKILLQKTHDILECFLELRIDYSSTCPQSAALSKEIFIQQLSQQSTKEEILQFIEQNGLLATPHAQRSQLDVTIKLKMQNVEELSLVNWTQEIIEKLEQCLGTPTQGLVKRVDEQQFAVLNAQNLMFCEDAARKVFLCLDAEKWQEGFWGNVSHFESLHSHDAVAHFAKV